MGALTAQSGVSQPAVSKHLGVLRQAGLVRDRHEGRQTHYSAQLGALAPLIEWTSQMAGFWQSRFDDLEDLLLDRVEIVLQLVDLRAVVIDHRVDNAMEQRHCAG